MPTLNIVPAQGQDQQSPFDSIRRFDENGKEYWMARELQQLLGYRRWDKFISVVAVGKENLELAIRDTTEHILPTGGLSTVSVPVPLQDYKLSRLACYHIALACDSRGKPEVKAAKHYFAIKTREAEIAIPALSEKLELARLENDSLKMMLEIEKLKDKQQGRQDYRITAHGLATTLLLEGKQGAVIEVERVIESTIDPRSNSIYSGQSLPAVVDHLKNISGTKYKNGTAIERRLEQLDESGLIATRPITIPHKYIPTESLNKAYELLQKGDQQQLL